MSDTKDGGPAFPFGVRVDRYDTYSGNREAISSIEEHAPGMSLRDWFAGQALIALASQTDFDTYSWRETAQQAYRQADAMLAARDAKGTKDE